MDKKPRTVFSDIRDRGHDEDFRGTTPQPTDIRPGPARIAVLMARAEAGEELWHDDDRNDYEDDPPPVVPDGNAPVAKRWQKHLARIEETIYTDPEAGKFEELGPDAI